VCSSDLFVKNIFTGNWQGAWDALVEYYRNVWETMKTIVKAPLNFIIDGVNTMIAGLNQLEIPDWVPAIGGMGIEIPLIPRLAAGGFTDGLSFAGEAGTEAVISFDPAYRSENLSYWAEAGRMLGAGSETDYLGGSTKTTVVYDMSGFSFAPHIEIKGSADKDELFKQLKEYEPEFFDLLEAWLERREAGSYAR